MEGNMKPGTLIRHNSSGLFGTVINDEAEEENQLPNSSLKNTGVIIQLENEQELFVNPDEITVYDAPEVGMPATICMISDRHPATIIKVSDSKKTVWVIRDDWKVISGNEFDGSAKYEYSRNYARNDSERFSLRDDGDWVKTGESAKRGTRLVIGTRRRYYDPSF